MKKYLTGLVFLISLNCFAQKQTFDLISYTAPAGWKKQATEQSLQLMKEDTANGTYCIIMLFKPLPAGKDSKANFDAAWETVVKGIVTISSPPEMQAPSHEDGWEAQSGYAPYQLEGTPGVAILATSTGFDKMVNILVLTNTDVYQTEMNGFFESVKISKPAGSTISKPGPKLNTQPVTNTGYAFSTTHFDDGWTNVIQDEWVLCTKGDIKVYIWYALPFNGSMFSGTGVRERDYYWDNYITRYYNVITKQYKDNGEVMVSFQPDYVEGWATDKQSGEKRFIAMRLGIAPNTAYIILASAKDEASLHSQFPTANGKYTSDLGGMDGYNKFGVSTNDIHGTWQNGKTSTAQWYYVTPSGYEGYAGMTVAATSATFSFGTDGNYTSVHNGATGAVGSLVTFQQNYKGKYTVTTWTITATNRWESKTEKFDAWFVAVKGGRILKMKSGGMEYTLVKVK